MNYRPSLWHGAAFGLALIGANATAGLHAQAVVQPIPGTTDADRLGEQMRALAANPNDLAALLRAGELSLKLDDLSGAASLFARAEKIDSRNARLKAGEASVLVRSERPGQALRYFAMAQSYGLDPAQFAGDRGLAYDLVGEQERAQRDYRLSLKTDASPEIARRYALSLGISGKRDAALAILDPLLRDTDRGAWRARAFVLAMAGDVAGAERIATTMMPPGMAEGLQPFFQRLPSLPAVDRAFAVHFGEIRATPERLADARLVPPLAPLGPDADAPVMVAKAAQVAPVTDSRKDRRARRKKDQDASRLALAVTRNPVAALPPPPAYSGQPIPTVAPGPMPTAPMNATARANAQALANLAAPAPAVAAARSTPTPTSTPTATPAPVRVASRRGNQPAVPVGREPMPVTPAAAPVIAVETPAQMPPPAAVALADTRAVAASTSPVVAAVAPPAERTISVPLAPVPTPVVVAAAASMPSPAVAPPAGQPAAAPTVTTAASIAPPGFSIEKPATDRPVPTALAARNDDSILARIVAGLSIPGAELGIPDMPGKAEPVKSEPTADTALVAEAKAKEERDAAAEKALAEKAEAEKAAAAKRAADRRAVADKKAIAEKKASDAKKAAEAKVEAAKKLAEAKAAAEEKKIARANPARIWVQVAGGAHVPDLPKAWAAAKANAPKAFVGKQGWWTPLKATNRVLAGPFKTNDEARDFVNALAKEGVSAFPFTSDAGQQVTRLSTK